MHAISSHFSSRVCLSFVPERARAYIESEKSGDGRRRNFVLSLRMASRIVSSLLSPPSSLVRLDEESPAVIEQCYPSQSNVPIQLAAVQKDFWCV